MQREARHVGKRKEYKERTEESNPWCYTIEIRAKMRVAGFFCDTLEPTRRDIGPGRPGRKLPGRTAIPEGRYPVAVTFSPHFGRWLPLLLHVPMFTGVRIHAGNTAEDTAGCILVGKNARPEMVLDSQIWLRRLVKRLGERPEGEGVWITVRDS